MITLLIYVLIMCLIFGLLLWLGDMFIADPKIKQIFRAIVFVIAVICLIYFLVGFLPGGGGGFSFRRP